jgi:PIN domain
MNSVHVLVDLENNQPTLDDIRRLVPDLTDAWLFHSPQQVAHLSSFAALGSRHTPVLISRAGNNALDFHLSLYVGYIAARHPGAKLVVVAIDRGYMPMIEHARTLGFDVEKVSFSAGGAPTKKRGTKTGGARIASVKKATAGTTPAKGAVARKPAKKTATGKAAVSKQAAQQPPVAKPPGKKTKASAPAKTAPAKQVSKASPSKAKAPGKKAPATHKPAATSEPAVSPVPRLEKIIVNLRKIGDKRPKKLEQLRRHLASLLRAHATDDAVTAQLSNLLAADALRVTGDAIDYTAKVSGSVV